MEPTSGEGLGAWSLSPRDHERQQTLRPKEKRIKSPSKCLLIWETLCLWKTVLRTCSLTLEKQDGSASSGAAWCHREGARTTLPHLFKLLVSVALSVLLGILTSQRAVGD